MASWLLVSKYAALYSSTEPSSPLEPSEIGPSSTVTGFRVGSSFSVLIGFSSRGFGGALLDRANPNPLKFSPLNAGSAIGFMSGAGVSDFEVSLSLLDGTAAAVAMTDGDGPMLPMPLSSGADALRWIEFAGTDLVSFCA